MPIFFEDTQKVTHTQIPIPKKLQNQFKKMLVAYEPYIDGTNNGKILKSYASDKQYNVKGSENSENNGEKKNPHTVSVEVAKKRIEVQGKLPNNSLQYNLMGGKPAEDLLKKGIERARSVQQVKTVQPEKPNAEKDTKPATIKTKTIEVPNGSISYTVANESILRKVYISEERITNLIKKGLINGSK